MPRPPMPTDTDSFAEETRSAIRHVSETRKCSPPPGSYLTYAGDAGEKLSEFFQHLRYRNAVTGGASGSVEVDRPWDSFTDGQLTALNHPGIKRFAVFASNSPHKALEV